VIRDAFGVRLAQLRLQGELRLHFGQQPADFDRHDRNHAIGIAKHQVTAEGWYVANPDLTVVDTRRLKRVSRIVGDLLDEFSK